MLHHPGPARDLREDEHPGMRHHVGLAAGSDEEQVNGVWGRSAAVQVNEGSVVGERGVERGEGEAFPGGVAPEVAPKRLGGMLERVAHRGHHDTVAGIFERGVGSRQSPVHEDEPAASGRNASDAARDLRVPDILRVAGGGPEGLPLERSGPGVLPVLVPRARESPIAESRDRRLPDLPQPGQIPAGQLRVALPVGLEVRRDGGRDVHESAASSPTPA